MNNDTNPRDVSARRWNPHCQWTCGYIELGLGCQHGPTDNGRCGRSLERHLAEQPNSQDKRPAELDALEQGLHAEPLPDCIPKRSLRASRRLWTLNLGILIGAALLFSMAVPSREALFVPGELSAKHAQILNNKLVAERCSLCHPSSHGNFFSSSIMAAQDELCLRCHTSHLPDAKLRSPHDLPREQLVALRRSSAQPQSANTLLISAKSQPIDWNNLDLNCAKCHREHHGRSTDLKLLGSLHCQACHQQQFDSFASGHPEFENFPVSHPNHVAFNHSAHSSKHFPQKNRQFDCRTCHLDSSRTGAIGSIFRTLGFDKACADCHAAPIKASIVDGWTILQIPSLDLNDTRTEGLGDWPEGARFGYEGEFSPAVRVLLSSDPAATQALSKLPESGKLADVPANLRGQVTRELAKAVRRLVDDTARDGQAAWRNRIGAALSQKLGRQLQAPEVKLVNDACAGLPPDLFRQIMTNWFKSRGSLASVGNVTAQSNNWRSIHLASQITDPLLTPSSPAQRAPAKKLTKLRGATHVSEGGWFLNADIMSVQYMPRGHADPILAGWTQIVSVLQNSNCAKKIPGTCVQCHNLPTSKSSLLLNPWQVKPRPENIRTFTKFTHEPHLTIPAINDCRFCHSLKETTIGIADRNIQLIASPSGGASSHFHTDQFEPMKLSQCSSCHRPDGANDGCTQCHNYHVGQVGLDWSRTQHGDASTLKTPATN